MKIELARLASGRQREIKARMEIFALEGRGEIKARMEIFAQSEPLRGWWCHVMVKLGRAGGDGGDLDTSGLRHLLGLTVGCQADRSMSSELRVKSGQRYKFGSHQHTDDI